MLLKEITAVPHPDGYRVDLSWINPDPVAFPGVRLRRRLDTHPVDHEDGVLVADLVDGVSDPRVFLDDQGRTVYQISDTGLKGETVYYYSLYPFNSGNDHQIDRRNRVSAMATAVHGIPDQMAGLLPAIYRRYDAAGPIVNDKGFLQRFLQVVGGELDLLQSFNRALLHAHNPNRVDGNLLPLLAQWIGWNTDFQLEIESQRNEIVNAPTIYKRVEIIPVVGATVKRISGWESRSKEFVYNVARSNQPERLNLWTRRMADDGSVTAEDALLSLNFAYEGRPAMAQDAEGVRWLFYQTLRGKQWQIWCKSAPATMQLPEMEPSHPVAQVKTGRHAKYPAAALQDNTLWVVWSEYDESAGRWQLFFRTRHTGTWSSRSAVFPNQPSRNRKMPAVVVDDNNGLWLFWLEQLNNRWQLCYNRYDVGDLVSGQPDPANWQLATSASFPLDGTNLPRVDGDFFVQFHPGEPNRPLWVFWARKDVVTTDPTQTRWTTVARVKNSIDPTLDDWGAITPLTKTDEEAHDKEPSTLIDSAGNITMFFSSNRLGAWSIWQARLRMDTVDPTWDNEQQVTTSLYAERNPLAVTDGSDTVLFYRCNASRVYNSEVYRATETVDFRYAGATTVHTRDVDKIGLKEAFDDFQTYTFDTGGQDSDWYRRDTLGVYVTPNSEEEMGEIVRSTERLKNVLPEFIPATDRAVLIREADS